MYLKHNIANQLVFKNKERILKLDSEYAKN